MNLEQLYQQAHAQVLDPDRLPVAVTALLLVSIVGVLVGPFTGNANPILWRAVDFLFGPLGSRLDKMERQAAELATRGTILVFMTLGLAYLSGQFFQTLSKHYNNFFIVDILALSLCMGAGAGWYALIRLYRALHSKELLKGAFYTLATTTRTNLALSDEFTITRTGIGMGAKLFDKGVVGPVLWYLIAGLPAAFIYTALSALSWRFGKEGFTKGFGSSALHLEKLMGFVPNVFAGFLIALGGLLTPTAGMTRSLLALLPGRSGQAAYEQGGAPVTAMAWALDVSLGGPVQDHEGSAIQRGWAGPAGATAKLDAKHLHRALYITIMAHLLFLAALLVAILLGG